MYDVTAVGELLIDFTPAGLSGQGQPLFEQNPGGAPANVLAALSRLGRRTAFIGKVGQDFFGDYLAGVLAQAQIACDGLLRDPSCRTTLAFVHLDPNGDRSFSFYRNPGADLMLRPEEIPEATVRDCRIFHFGSVSMTGDPARGATRHALELARRAGRLVSYDPNLRLPLWSSPEDARQVILAVLDRVDVLKISEEELTFLTGLTDLEQGARWFFDRAPLQLLLITRGAKGAYGATRRAQASHPAFDVQTIDTTGAGDAFTGAVLHRLLKRGKDPGRLTAEELESDLAYANAAGSLATTRTGAIPALPTEREIQNCLTRTRTLT